MQTYENHTPIMSTSTDTSLSCAKWKSEFVLMSNRYISSVNSGGNPAIGGRLHRLIHDVDSCDMETQINVIHDVIYRSKK
jgi:hypothetical protein